MAPCQSLLPSFLYDGGVSARGAPNGGGVVVAGAGAREAAVVAGAPSEPPFGKIDMFWPAYYAACGFGGAATCGLTHAAVTPLDVIKCNIQVSDLSHTMPRVPRQAALLSPLKNRPLQVLFR
ncbi:hypothetical protein GUJ93_ZPchr0002g24722 [Zizania palustris]|uniref:Uncharacterized protein n=1 Tax=Zizania palustris TaxID=103762 RepID=A0A8J5VA26_ZIZPA|nr:hypothetical protein GUJ93_ZPchr0002g24722 [Zizania palustris]